LESNIESPDLIRDVKSDSSLFVNKNGLTKERFHWQEGYGAFTYSRGQRERVINYIKNQEAHHRYQTFRKEYFRLLESQEVAYDEKYLFDFFD